MTNPDVQQAIVDSISCSTPIGRALNNQIDDRVAIEISADNIEGLGRVIDQTIEDAFNGFEVDADNVNGLDRTISSAVEDILSDNDDLTNEITEKVAHLLIERLMSP